jgi:hypothetical protein
VNGVLVMRAALTLRSTDMAAVDDDVLNALKVAVLGRRVQIR